MNGSDPTQCPANDRDRVRPARPQSDAGGDCPQCPVRRPVSRIRAEVAAARAMGLFEVYECPSGLGWHLRLVKNFWQD